MALCSRCADNQAASGHRWCKNCKALHQRERTALLEDRLFRKGLAVMRTAAIEAFYKIGPGQMTGYTAADIMRTLTLE